MNVEGQVAAHYTPGMLEEKILGALRAAGKNVEQLSEVDLEMLDSFHVGGHEATSALAGVLAVQSGAHLLDVGCGIGGPARVFAEQGYDVTGIDLSEEFVGVAESLTRRVKLAGRAHFRQGSALKLPFDPESFDGAFTIHAAMNIEDKAGVFREVRRVLKPGGRFGIFDIMGAGNENLTFPLPWAVDPGISFVASEQEYRDALESAGFRIDHERDRRAFAVEFMHRLRDRAAAGATPVLGVHLLMGEQAPAMLRNVSAAMESGTLRPVELVATAA